MKVGVLVGSQDAVKRFLSQPIPFESAWDLKLFIEKTDPERKAYVEAHHKLLAQYGEKYGEGQMKLKPECIVEYKGAKDILDEKDTSCEPTAIPKDLLKNRNIEISTDDLMKLNWLIK